MLGKYTRFMLCYMMTVLLIGTTVYLYNEYKTSNIETEPALQTEPFDIAPETLPIVHKEEVKEDITPIIETEPEQKPEPEVVPEPEPEPEPEKAEPIVGMETEITALAKLMYGEARGVASVTEQACVAWVVLNRVDAGQGTIMGVITAPHQFHYIKSNPTVDDYGRDLKALAADILSRWQREKNGETNVGRVLPSDYLFFHGKGGHNWFRRQYKHNGHYWNYSLTSPYES